MHEYYTDGLFLKHFKIFPEGCDPNNLLPVQKEFIILLLANTPSLDDLTNYLLFSQKVKDLDDKKYKLNVTDSMAIALAKNAGLTLEEYKQQEFDKYKEQDIIKLKKDYGFLPDTDDEEDEQKTLQNKYDIQKNKMDKLKIFKKPDFLGNG